MCTLRQCVQYMYTAVLYKPVIPTAHSHSLAKQIWEVRENKQVDLKPVAWNQDISEF